MSLISIFLVHTFAQAESEHKKHKFLSKCIKWNTYIYKDYIERIYQKLFPYF